MNEITKLAVNGQEYTLTDAGAVAFDKVQTLTDEQQLQARLNIDAASATDMENEIDRLDEAIAGIGTGGSITVDDALDPNSTNPVQNKVIAQMAGELNTVLAGFTPDDALNAESTNPVQNKVVTQTINEIGAYVVPKLLPTVTADDNGKFLRVVDGAWVAVSLQDVSEVGL